MNRRLTRPFKKLAIKALSAVKHVDRNFVKKHGIDAYNKTLSANAYNGMVAGLPHAVNISHFVLPSSVKKIASKSSIGRKTMGLLYKYGAGS